jgi:hypothetical protein
MDIDSFKSSVGSMGLQKSSHYMVEMYPPAGLSVPRGNINAHTFVKDVSLPGRNISTSEVKYGSLPTMKQAYNSIPNDCSVTFMADGNMELWRFFQAWQNKIHDPMTGYVGYPDDYKGLVKVKTMNTLGEVTHEQALYDAFPENVGDISLSYGAEEIASFTVTFAYTRTEAGGSPTFGGGISSILGGLLGGGISVNIGPINIRIPLRF